MPSAGRRTSVTPKKLRARNSTGGWRTNVARSSTNAVAMARNHGRAPTVRISPPTSSQRTADLGHRRAGRHAGRPTRIPAPIRYGPTRPRKPRTNGLRSRPNARPGPPGDGRRPGRPRRGRRARRPAGSGTPRRPGRPAARRARRRPMRARHRRTGSGRTRSGGVGSGRSWASRPWSAIATIPNATSSMTRSARIGQPPAEPYGTHSSVTIAGAARTASRTRRPPRGENATMNEAR